MAMKRSHKKTDENNSVQSDPVKAAIDYGIDISMLIQNLKRPPGERIRRHQIALDTTLALCKAKRI